MNSNERIKLSKFLSLILRHDPSAAGIQLDGQGWVEVDTLLAAVSRTRKCTRADLEEIVATSDKKRFAFSEDGTRIRANQGHSVQVDLQLVPQTPPDVLYHGTVQKFMDSIRSQGLIRGQRHHVHLSADRETADKVGSRRGKPVILRVNAAAMHAAGHVFYFSANGVWLVDAVPPEFLMSSPGSRMGEEDDQ